MQVQADVLHVGHATILVSIMIQVCRVYYCGALQLANWLQHRMAVQLIHCLTHMMTVQLYSKFLLKLVPI